MNNYSMPTSRWCWLWLTISVLGKFSQPPFGKKKFWVIMQSNWSFRISFQLKFSQIPPKPEAWGMWVLSRKGPSGFSASSTAEEVTQGIDGAGFTAVVTGHFPISTITWIGFIKESLRFSIFELDWTKFPLFLWILFVLLIPAAHQISRKRNMA